MTFAISQKCQEIVCIDERLQLLGGSPGISSGRIGGSRLKI